MLLLVAACTKGDSGHEVDTSKPLHVPPVLDAGPGSAAQKLAVQTYDDLKSAIAAIVPADARVIGFGELHARTDRAQVKSALARFTADELPAIGDRLSDLIIETWLVDKNCGKQATEATAKVEITTRRPQETKSEIGELAEAARKAGIQPHAMRLTCDDYKRIAPPATGSGAGDVDPVAMLQITTKELGRIATEAVVHRDKEANHRPWIALYGGALHNDRFPEPSVADWSYAKQADTVTHDHFVEIDLVVPELAEADPMLEKQPWYAIVKTAGADKLQVWKRGERSFVIVFPRTPK